MESQNAPKTELVPDWRAIWPSIRSLNTKAVITSTPCQSIPCGKKTRAPAATPSVPTSVTASGLMPSLRKRLTKGASMTPCQKFLKRSSTAVRLPVRTRGLLWRDGAIQASEQESHMSDKSPRQQMTKKTGKSIKEKRADKRAKTDEVLAPLKSTGKK